MVLFITNFHQFFSNNRRYADDYNHDYRHSTACNDERNGSFEYPYFRFDCIYDGLQNCFCVSDRILKVFLQDPHCLL